MKPEGLRVLVLVRERREGNAPHAAHFKRRCLQEGHAADAGAGLLHSFRPGGQLHTVAVWGTYAQCHDRAVLECGTGCHAGTDAPQLSASQ